MYRGVAGICIATVLFVCSAAGFPVPPNTLPTSSGALTLTSNGTTISRFASGSVITVGGSGFQPDSNLTIAGYSSPVTLAQITADGNGAFARAFQMPSDFRGTHTLTAIGTAPGGAPRVLSARVVITTAPVVGELARTGLGVARVTAFGIASLILGVVLVRSVGFRRRLLPLR